MGKIVPVLSMGDYPQKKALLLLHISEAQKTIVTHSQVIDCLEHQDCHGAKMAVTVFRVQPTVAYWVKGIFPWV